MGVVCMLRRNNPWNHVEATGFVCKFVRHLAWRLSNTELEHTSIEPYLPTAHLLHTVARRSFFWLARTSMREWLEYAAGWGILKTLGNLPRGAARGVGSGGARAVYVLLPKVRKRAEGNVSVAFPDWCG